MKYKGKVDEYYLVNYLADMESKIFICQCGSPEHQLTFNYFPNEREGDVYLWIYLRPDSFWNRIKNAIKYIFGHRSKYGDFDEFIFRKEDADKLQEVVNYLKP